MNDRSKPAFRGPTAGMPMVRWQFDINDQKTVAAADWQAEE
jgi:hypothetical protein